MKQFAYRAIREALLGLVAGGFAAIAIKLAVALSGNIWCLLESHFPVSTIDSIIKGGDFKILGFIIASCLLLLLVPRIASFFLKLLRSWSTGLFSGIFSVWFLLTLLFFVPEHSWSLKRSLTFVGAGVLFIFASRGIVLIRRRYLTNSPIVTPEPSQAGAAVETEVKFDLPIQAWSEDRLKRGTLIRGMADQILREKAPVLAIVGTFGEGKTSALNLLAASFVNRSDVILVHSVHGYR
jgi:hypothetical protein